MEHVNFRPWIGKNYNTRGYKGNRILVLGESHYCQDLSNGKCSQCTKDNMHEWCLSFTEDVIHSFVYLKER